MGHCTISLYDPNMTCLAVVDGWKASQTSSYAVQKARHVSTRDQQWMQPQSEAEGLEACWTVTGTSHPSSEEEEEEEEEAL